MLEYINRKYLVFLVVIPMMIIGGVGAGPIAILVGGIATMYFMYTGQHDLVIILFLSVLVLGDSRAAWLQFVKPVRVEMLVFMTLWTLNEIRVGRYRFSTLFLYFLPFLLVSLIALTFSPILGLGINKTLSFTMLYFVVLHYFRDKFSVYGLSLLRDIVMLAHLVLLMGLLLLPLFPQLVSYGGVRFNGMMGNPNGLGIFLTLTVPITAYVFKEDYRFSKQYRAFAWFLVLVSLVMCSSRNAIFAFMVFMVLYKGLAGTTFRQLIFIFVILPTIGLLMYNIELESVIQAFGLEKYFRLKDFQSGSGRIYAWQHAWLLIQQNPLIGCGFACEEYNFVARTSWRLWATGHQGGVHNSYLAFMINTGFIGFLCYMGCLIAMFRKIKDVSFLLPYLASIFFSAMFESWMFSSLSAFHIFFLLTIAWLIQAQYQPELTKPPPEAERTPKFRPRVAAVP